jgi:hypothetical protein
MKIMAYEEINYTIFELRSFGMIKKLAMLSRVALFSLLTACFAITSLAATVKVDPAASIKQVGDTFSVNISGDALSGLYAFQWSIGYNPAILQMVDVTEGAFLPTGGSTFFIAGTIDNVGGIAKFVGNTLIGAIPGVSGSGVLATINFKALSNGLSALMLQDVLFLDSSPNTMTMTKSDGTVTVGSPTPQSIPTLSEWAMILLSLFITALACSRLQQYNKV